MGIFIHMSISKSVTKREWEEVYEETLQLVKAFPFAERQQVKCKGIETFCLVPTVEREKVCRWDNGKRRRGWFADGDYETMHTAETYALYRDLIQYEDIEKDAGDALMGVLPAYLNYKWDDPRCNHIINIWGAKTQGEPYHMYLLAVACLIEFRLKEKAFVYGDITRGQCKKAVELANLHLDKPIDVPDRCDIERFRMRVSKLPISAKEQFEVFDSLYLGTKDAEYGEYIRSKYPEEICDEYWRDEFEHCYIGTHGFDSLITEYLLWGFELDKLCRLVNCNDKNNVPQYEKFVRRILDAKLHLKCKNCKDVLEIDQEEESPYSIYTLMAQFAYAGAKNKKVDRYIPIDKIKKILVSELGDKCNVEPIIEEYLRKEEQETEIKLSVNTENGDFQKLCEQDASEVLGQMIEMKRQSISEEYEKYDITTHEELIYYEAGDIMEPNLLNALLQSFAFYNSIVEEEEYTKLMKQSPKIRCEWLVGQNRSILIREQDWNKIFTDIEENVESFSRYYPMVRLKLNHDELVYMTIAIILNDELYDYLKNR